MSEKIYPKGIRTFKPHENAPPFVKGSLIITPSEIVKFCEENKNLMRDYNGVPQLRCQLLDGDNGIYVNVDTYGLDVEKQDTPAPQHNANDIPPAPEDDLDLPF